MHRSRKRRFGQAAAVGLRLTGVGLLALAIAGFWWLHRMAQSGITPPALTIAALAAAACTSGSALLAEGAGLFQPPSA
ncbi:hypothetical protein ACX40Y_00310 [Sphingomonas sp. RS6]